MADCGRKECVPVLLRVIADAKTLHHRSTLVYACSEFDCSEWVLEFAKLWASSGPELDHHVLDIFDEMGAVHRVQVERAIAVVDAIRRDENALLSRRIDAARVIEHLQQLDVWV